MLIPEFLTLYFFIAIGLCLAGLLGKLLPMPALHTAGRTPAAVHVIDAPSPQSMRLVAKKLLGSPLTRFHYKANRTWAVGYVLYHVAIAILVSGYMLSAFILLGKMITGSMIPDFVSHAPLQNGYSISNILAFIFGNAETYPSQFLFGSLSPYFQALAWIDFPLAAIGNACLLYAVVSRRAGAVCSNIDEATADIRIQGVFSGQHLLVRTMILGIILTEFIGRWGWLPGIVYVHAFLGLSLVALLPYTYLIHIPLAPLTAWLAIRRQRRNIIA